MSTGTGFVGENPFQGIVGEGVDNNVNAPELQDVGNFQNRAAVNITLTVEEEIQAQEGSNAPQQEAPASQPESVAWSRAKKAGKVALGAAIVAIVAGVALLLYMYLSNLGINSGGFAKLGKQIKDLWNAQHHMTTAEIMYKVLVPTVGAVLIIGILAFKGKTMKDKAVAKLQELRDYCRRNSSNPLPPPLDPIRNAAFSGPIHEEVVVIPSLLPPRLDPIRNAVPPETVELEVVGNQNTNLFPDTDEEIVFTSNTNPQEAVISDPNTNALDIEQNRIRAPTTEGSLFGDD